jgi:hypothetical protein
MRTTNPAPRMLHWLHFAANSSSNAAKTETHQKYKGGIRRSSRDADARWKRVRRPLRRCHLQHSLAAHDGAHTHSVLYPVERTIVRSNTLHKLDQAPWRGHYPSGNCHCPILYGPTGGPWRHPMARWATRAVLEKIPWRTRRRGAEQGKFRARSFVNLVVPGQISWDLASYIKARRGAAEGHNQS